MADGNTLYKLTPDKFIGTTPEWHVWEVKVDDGAATTETDLISLPIGSMLLDVDMRCSVARAGGTSTLVHLRLETGPVTLVTGQVATMATIGTLETNGLAAAGMASFVTQTGLAAANVLQAQSVVVGATSPSGTIRIGALLYRVQIP